METAKNKRFRGLMLAGILVLAAASYLFVRLKPVSTTPLAIEPLPPSQEQIAEHYRQEILPAYQALADTAGAYFRPLDASGGVYPPDDAEALALLSERLSGHKVSLMEMTVPGEHRDLHLSLVMAIDGLRSALDKGDAGLYKEKYDELLGQESLIP